MHHSYYINNNKNCYISVVTAVVNFFLYKKLRMKIKKYLIMYNFKNIKISNQIYV